MILVLHPLVDLIAFDSKAAQNPDVNASGILNITSAMTIRPIPLKKREMSAKSRPVVPLDMIEPQHVAAVPIAAFPPHNTQSTSRPQSAMARSRPQSARARTGGTTSQFTRQHQNLAEIYHHHPLTRGTSAALKIYPHSGIGKRNVATAGLRLIPLGQQAVSSNSFLNDMVYGTGIGGGNRHTWDMQPSRPGTSIGKRLPPLRATATPTPTYDHWERSEEVNTARIHGQNRGNGSNTNRHVFFDEAKEFDDLRTVSVKRPLSARKPQLGISNRAKSARPVLRDDVRVCFSDFSINPL